MYIFVVDVVVVVVVVNQYRYRGYYPETPLHGIWMTRQQVNVYYINYLIRNRSNVCIVYE